MGAVNTFQLESDFGVNCSTETTAMSPDMSLASSGCVISSMRVIATSTCLAMAGLMLGFHKGPLHEHFSALLSRIFYVYRKLQGKLRILGIGSLLMPCSLDFQLWVQFSNAAQMCISADKHVCVRANINVDVGTKACVLAC